MSDPNAYIMLISGLPRPAGLFLAKRPPLSRLKLEARLRILAPEDAEVLHLTESVLHWGEMPISMTDEEILVRIRKAMAQIENETVRAIIRDRLEIRTCMSALRRRFHGEGAPTSGSPWGYGRWMSHIERNWSEETFNLALTFPWLREANRLLKAGETLQLQRMVLEQAWKSASRHIGEHYFDFEAVVIYVVQWNIVDRWGRYSSEPASEHFEELTDAALGDHRALFEGEQ